MKRESQRDAHSCGRPSPPAHGLSVGQCATVACLLEVNAPKVGNVHRGADFAQLTLNDFALSAAAIGPAMERAGELGVGATVLAAIEATRRVAATNTNLGIVLLFAPLASAARLVASSKVGDLRAGVAAALGATGPRDADDVYAAIRLAAPGGMGEAPEMDIREAAPPSLLDAMAAAADRDLVARQYRDRFAMVFDEALPALLRRRARGDSWPRCVVGAHVELLALHGDSLIARKCGAAVSREAADRAAAALDTERDGEEAWHGALADLDFWLRSDGQRRNPGATADLLAAALFALLLEDRMAPPFG